MKRKSTDSKSVTTLLVMTLLALGLLAGCAGNSSERDAAVAEDDAAATAADDAAQSDAADQERQIAARQRELDRREAELERKEVAADQRQSGTTATRQTPRQTPRAVPAADPQPRTVTLTVPTTTAIQVEFLESLSSEESLAGDPVRVAVVNDVVQDGFVAIPAGSTIEGTVAEVKKGKKVGGRARMALQFTTLHMPSGEPVSLNASLELQGKSQTGKDAATIGGATAGGAILGRVVGGDDKTKSTAIGAVVGAAVGTAVAANNKADPVLIESGQTTDLLLYEPLRMTLVEPASADRLANNR